MTDTATIPEGNLARGLNEIVRRIRAFERWPENVEVEEWRGRFNLTHIKRYSKKFPAVFVTLNGGTRERQVGTTYTNAQVLAYVVVKGAGSKRRTTPSRYELALLIAERLLDALTEDLVWRAKAGDGNVTGMPIGGRFDNALDRETDEGGLSVLFVSWTMPIEHSGADVEGMADLSTIVSTWNAEEFVPGANPDRPDPDNFPTGDDTSIQTDV